MKIRHILPGLRPEPLASYLGGLGLIRVLGEQADPDATAAWSADALAVTTTVEDIAAWLADSYVPTPVLSPWNNGSGFGAKDKEPLVRLEALRKHASLRLARFREAITIAEAVVCDARDQSWADEKKRIVLGPGKPYAGPPSGLPSPARIAAATRTSARQCPSAMSASRNARNSSPPLNTVPRSPRARASSTSASLSCHSGVQNHAWSSGMREVGVRTIRSSSTVTINWSPSVRSSLSRTSCG